MKQLTFFTALVVACGCVAATATFPSAKDSGFVHATLAGEPLVVSGRTQCINTRKAIIATAVLHPVVEVLVSEGSKVKKGQALVKLDDDEPKADVRGKKASLQNMEIALMEAKRLLASVEGVQGRGVLPEQRIHEVKTLARKAEIDVKVAQAVLDAAVAELEHYTIEAAIDGVVNRLQVHPGTVTKPGTENWGEILDLSEIDVCCYLNLKDVDLVAVDQDAEVLNPASGQSCGTGKVVFIGLEFDAQKAGVPAHIRLSNASGRLRCGVPVQVRFPGTSGRDNTGAKGL